jgi:muconolactone delta-isomerase
LGTGARPRNWFTDQIDELARHPDVAKQVDIPHRALNK